jgi:hypothetical protein
MIFCICGAAFLETYSSTELCDIWMTDLVPNFPWDNFKNQQVGCRFPPQAARQACNHGYPSFPSSVGFCGAFSSDKSGKTGRSEFFFQKWPFSQIFMETYFFGRPSNQRTEARSTFYVHQAFSGFRSPEFFSRRSSPKSCKIILPCRISTARMWR